MNLPETPDPDVPAPPGSRYSSTEHTGEDTVRPTRLRVLIVEDSEDDTDLLLRALRRDGYDPVHLRVDTAAAMRAALDDHTWDIIIADYVMPQFSGPDALALLRDQGIDLPVIIISGQIGEDVAVAAIQTGAHDYLMKFNLSRLQPAIERALREVHERHEREQAQKALGESEASFRMILDTANDAFISINADGVITAWNRQAEITFGWPREEIIGQPLREAIIPPRYREAHQRGLHECLATGTGKELYKRMELTALHRDGHEFPVELAVWPTRVGDNYYFHAFIRDTTERKRAEAELRRAYDELEVRVRERTEELATANAALQTTIIDLHLAERERLALLAGEQEARRRVEQSNRALERATRAKSEFLATMSHEIRTPLNGVIGMTDLLLQSDLTPEQREYATTARRSGEMLLTILSDVLDLSKIEAGQMTLETVPFTLDSLLADVCAFQAAQAGAKRLRLGWHSDVDVPTLLGDLVRLRQVLLNLVGNAVKFTERGSIDVRVRLADASATTPDLDVSAPGAGRPCSPLTLRFEVVDTGIGIPLEAQAALFDPFSQADGSTTRRYGGTGLGLAIVRRLVGLMGGELGVDSEPGRGSTFWFTAAFSPAPAAPAATPPAATTPPAPPAATGAATGTILVADDSSLNRRVVASMLRQLGYQVEMVSSGREALAALAGRAFDAVLMDCWMPDLDGFDATRELRRREAAGEHVPVIALTADVLTDARGRCQEAGMDDYLPKPMRIEDLAALLQRWAPLPGTLPTGETAAGAPIPASGL
jgi:PAS domain S-box-containing protein